MSRPARFQVDPRLTLLLGETYRSSEQAIKELVDNAWDADAKSVWITLPDPLTADPLIIRDDGTGMIEKEVREDYLKIARDRRVLKGDRTSGKRRLVKGRKGIGKFAGLMVASFMNLETRARGQQTRLAIPKDDLIKAEGDLERIPLDITTAVSPPAEHGTQITLLGLYQHLSFPDPDRLKQLLVLEYGREEDFQILVNGTRVGLEDVRGTPGSVEANLPNAGFVRLRLRITDDQQPSRQAGIAVRIGGKIVGRPSFFGLEHADDIPRKLLRRVYGEIEADGLLDDVTADWGGVIENSKGYAEVEAFVQEAIRSQLQDACQQEMNLAKARLQQQINRSLERMPEHRREFARRAIERIMLRFYDETEERITPIVSVVLEALEHDEYWQVLDRVDKARHQDVGMLAQALHDFGVLELSAIAQQARRRLTILDQLDALIANPETHEQTVHKALELNLWALGSEFALMSSNQTLASVLQAYARERFTGPRASTRPDLLLLSRFAERYVLIEFKRPSHSLTRLNISQAEQYRDDLLKKFAPIHVWVIGKDYDSATAQNLAPNITIASYSHIVNRARQELGWLLQELGAQAQVTVE